MGISNFIKRLGNSLATKLTIWFLLLSLLPIAVVVLFVGPVVNSELKDIEIINLDYRASGLAIVYDNLPQEILYQVISKLSGVQQKVFAMVSTGSYIAHYDISSINLSAYNDFEKSTIDEILAQKNGVLEKEGRIFAFSSSSSGAIVVVYVGNSVITTPIKKLHEEVFIKLGISLLIVSIAGGMVIWFLIGPVFNLAKAAEEVGAGNLDVKIDASEMEGELKTLAISFNKMVDDLKKSKGGLEKSNADLEKKVDERTKELQLKNEELEKFNKMAVGRELKMVELKKK